jgi:hypothetical protein
MPARELAGRTKQHVSRWVDRASAPVWPLPGRVLAREAPRLAADPAARFDENVRTRFFAGAADPDRTAQRIRECAPEAVEATIAAADRIVGGRFDLLGYRDLDAGSPVDWHRDAASGRQAPRWHWTRLDPLDASVVGDSKVTWELSRQQWMLTLAQAYLWTKDARYLDTAATLFDAWLEENPPGIGLNWASSLEASFRLIAWSWTFALLRDTPFATPRRLTAAAAAIWRHARHVARYLSHYFSPNTHLTGEALGLVYAGVLFPDFRDASAWLTLGTRVLLDELDRQITTDGAHFERASCYHRYTLEIYLHLIVLCDRAHVSLPASVRDRFAAMTDYLAAICDPDATMPNIGDADGGWLTPFVPRDPQDCAGALGAAAVLTGALPHSDATGTGVPEALWIHGPEMAQSRPASATPSWTSRAFAETGVVVMRSGWQPDSHRLIFDAGPLGCHVSGAHGHADLLSIAVRAFGEDVLVDAGTGAYCGPWREYFRSSHAHSTLVVDGRSQAATDGPFSWRSRPAALLETFDEHGPLVLARGRHDAYSRPGDPITHRRSVTFVDLAYWLVVDDVDGVGEHELTLRYQCGVVDARRHDDRWSVIDTAGGAVWIAITGPRTMTTAIRSGVEHPPEGWISRRYGDREPAPAIVATAVVRLPARFVTAIVPTPDRTTPPALDLDAWHASPGARPPTPRASDEDGRTR